MPQLDPSPWFAILLFSWSVFLIIVIPKTMAHTFPNDPAPQSTDVLKTEPWNWPWV